MAHEDTAKSDTARREEEILAFWKQDQTFEKTLGKKAPNGEFVFYDGPPFATGLPHMGSVLSSVIKDVIPRYKTMRGYHVPRRWGWDCHGLPIETLIEKRLELKTKKDIEKIGIDVFNEAARASVLEFEHEWEKYVDRIGRFVDFKNSYKTMDNSYVESVWWALKSLHEKELLYEGRKVLMYCSHCETPLAKAEIAMDNTYKDITEEAVTVKFKIKNPSKHGFPEHTYMLAWTTTPWTLPGNVALALNKDIEYILGEKDGEYYILAKERAEGQFVISNQIRKGEELIGLEYEPLFNIHAFKSDKSYKVYAADFVTTGEGTGIVHTAVMYGEDDFALGQKEKLPMVQLLDPSAHYNDQAPVFIRGKYIKQAEKFIKADLEERGLLFGKEMHTHSYPHCYRCGTPLIYNAVASWFINIQSIKQRMLQENEQINWVPEHLKHGRFRNIVENAPDWTISRNRFWASPLPIWKAKTSGDKAGSSPDASQGEAFREKYMVIGSLEELKRRVKKSGNRYFVMRHGEAEHMIKGIFSDDKKGEYGLTLTGREQVSAAAKEIPRGKPMVIISSPVRRARESAEIMAGQLGISKENIIIDARLAELGFGDFDGHPKKEWLQFMERPDWYTARPHNGENFADAKQRFGAALYDYEARYLDSAVLMVTHAIAFESLLPICTGAQGNDLLQLVGSITADPAQVIELPFTPLPLNHKFEIDLHRPYIDSLVLLDDDGREYERIPEVVDCWVESGCMPFAQDADRRRLHAYEAPTTLLEKITYPADFIAEYIAQTRTWFYYLHAIGVGLFDRSAFRNVVSTGTILAADGSKMSKSKGNYTDPLVLMDRYGADAVRFELMNSVVMQAEDLNFRDEDVREIHNRVIGILWNSYKFFELYKHEFKGVVNSAHSAHPLDRWIRSRLGQTTREVTDAMEEYNTPPACRALRTFIEDYSTWYLRRSRDRVKGEIGEDAQYALAIQRGTLLTLAKLLAPITPFIAESLYQGLGEKGSVHSCDWPEEIGVDEKLIETMAHAREIASKALELRDRAGIKVRQPLLVLEARELPEDDAIRTIIAEEVNVKRIVQNGTLEEEVWIDTEITEELREEGIVRDTVRAIQDLRKNGGFNVSDRPMLRVSTDKSGELFLRKYRDTLVQQTNLAALHIDVSDSAPSSGLPYPAAFTLQWRD